MEKHILSVPSIETVRLTRRYHGRPAVDRVSLTVEPGQIYGLVGRNGAGKTTLIRMLTGQTLPDEGEIRLFGEDGALLSKARHRIGAVVETPAFFPYLSGEENLRYYQFQRGIPHKDRPAELIKLVGLEEAGNRPFKQYSLGMKQRLGLALALLGEPALLLLDEPTNGLDPLGIIQVRQLLLKLNREQGVTILISSHILSELSTIATHYGFLDRGQVKEQISAKQLADRCRDSLELRVSDAEKASVVLEQQLGCRDFEVLPERIFRLHALLDQPERVIRILVEHGVEIFSAIPHSFDLEQYFVTLVEQEPQKGENHAESHTC